MIVLHNHCQSVWSVCNLTKYTKLSFSLSFLWVSSPTYMLSHLNNAYLAKRTWNLKMTRLANNYFLKQNNNNKNPILDKWWENKCEEINNGLKNQGWCGWKSSLLHLTGLRGCGKKARKQRRRYIICSTTQHKINEGHCSLSLWHTWWQ